MKRIPVTKADQGTFIYRCAHYSLSSPSLSAADDIAETPLRAVGAALSDTAVASAACYFGMGASAIFLVTRRDRDIRLPKYAEIEINFARVN